MPEGRYTIPARIYLTAEQRDKLTTRLLEQRLDLSELLSELLISFLDHLPETETPDTAAPAPPEDNDDLQTELRQRRAEVRRLRARIAAQGNTAPQWAITYVADLEREIARLEQQQ
jgi:hypothetical protein